MQIFKEQLEKKNRLINKYYYLITNLIHKLDIKSTSGRNGWDERQK